ncbi:unnamed protein product [Linum trigynum]
MLYFLIFSFLCFQAHGADRITTNQSLSGDQTIVSSGGTFAMGFFSPGNKSSSSSNSSSNHYIGIWYNQIPLQTVVWVANRETPVSNRFAAQLRISDGNLVLFNDRNLPVWSIISNSTSAGIEAVLLDDGNLVLSASNRSDSSRLWESFDHPVNNWLPGGRLGFNKITKQNSAITSWKSANDPSPGPFSVSLDVNGTDQYLIFYNSTDFWRSGPWDPVGRIFSLVPEMRALYAPPNANIYNYSFVDNDVESYATYTMNSSVLVSRFVMDVGGQIQQLSWILGSSQEWTQYWTQPRVQCEVYGYCGSFGSCTQRSQPFCRCLQGFVPKSEADYGSNVFYGGCTRRAGLECSSNGNISSSGDGFLPYYDMKLPSNPRIQVSGAENAGGCRGFCLNRCSCTAYSYDDRNHQCLVWFGELLNLEQDVPSGSTIFVRVAASELRGSDSHNALVIGGVVGSAMVLVLAAVIGVLIWRKRRMRKLGGKSAEGSLRAFSYRDLQSATRNFSDKLGEGGFGSVYKGVLSDSTVAVKKLEGIRQGEKQFRSEVSTIGTIQHVNLVRLVGFCSEGAHKLLVYDHMPNRSLDSHLFNHQTNKDTMEGSGVLSWKTRYNIAMGTARGLTYLHEKCRDCIIHCDVKPENILLDAYMCPKVADFGLAKLVGRDFSRVLTTMRGTRGYLAPEWISGTPVTSKVDVYSYGMMLFEFVSGRRNLGRSNVDGEMRFFPYEAMTVINEGGDVVELLDRRLGRDADPNEILRVCKVACWCIQDDESHRPMMSQVVQVLEGILNVGMPTIPKTVSLLLDDEEQVEFFTKSTLKQQGGLEERGGNLSSEYYSAGH